MIINIRGTSGSGKSTLVQRFLAEHENEPILGTFDNWKKPKAVAYKVSSRDYTTYVIGRYETQCGGCDAMSYKGSHDDIEALVRQYAELGNVIFEGLTISSTLTRWRRISDEKPGQFIWAFMTTPVEECYRRIMSRNGGREPKRDSKGLADYQRKYIGCMRHMSDLQETDQKVLGLTSDYEGYEKMLESLHAST